MQLSDRDRRDLETLRRRLHGAPELSGSESSTAATIAASLERLRPDAMLTGLGGHGVAALLHGSGARDRPILLRCELDALPIDESIQLAHGSSRPNVAHKCGHDGHMAIVLGAGTLQRQRLQAGLDTPTLVLLFQPAEETGAGAAAVIEDGRLDDWSPSAAIALHNLPGYELGVVVVREGTFACASCGARIALRGAPTHASTPAQGRAPTTAMTRLLAELPALPERLAGEYGLVTVVYAHLGTPDFGVSPGAGLVMATLRAERTETLDRLRRWVVDLASAAARAAEVAVEVTWHDEYPATVNEPRSVDAVRKAAAELDRPIVETGEPLRFSEDFAHLTARYGGAMFGLGAGRDCPPLHDVAYDFPDELIPIGASALLETASRQPAE